MDGYRTLSNAEKNTERIRQADMNRKTLTEGEKTYIREHLPRSTYSQVARDIGRNVSCVWRYAQRNNRAASIEEGKAARRKALELYYTEENKRLHNEKIKKSIVRMIKKEHLRVRWGLEQKTNRRIDLAPYYIKRIRYRLKKQMNYVTQECRNHRRGDMYAIYYDSETRRSPREDYYTRTYGFKFIPLD